MKCQPVLECNSKMNFLLLEVLCLNIFVSQVLSEEKSYEYSDQHPWPVVYTVYPFYNSETLLEVWNAEKSGVIPTDVVTISSDKRDKLILYSNNNKYNDTNLQTENNVSYFISGTKNINEAQSLKNAQLSSYRNRHRDESSE